MSRKFCLEETKAGPTSSNGRDAKRQDKERTLVPLPPGMEQRQGLWCRRCEQPADPGQRPGLCWGQGCVKASGRRQRRVRVRAQAMALGSQPGQVLPSLLHTIARAIPLGVRHITCGSSSPSRNSSHDRDLPPPLNPTHSTPAFWPLFIARQPSRLGYCLWNTLPSLPSCSNIPPPEASLTTPSKTASSLPSPRFIFSYDLPLPGVIFCIYLFYY